MYDINTCYKIVLLATDKNRSQGYVSPQDFNLAFNQAQRSYESYLLGSFQTYRPGRPISQVELGQNSDVRQRLSPIIYGYNLNVDTTGFSPYPGDYLQTDAMWTLYGYNRVRFIGQEQLYSVYGSVIDPYQTTPFYVLEDNGFRFFPQSLENARLNYVRNVPDAVWGYVDGPHGEPVYDPTRSTQPVWDDASILEVLTRALAIIGVNLQLGVVSQYAEIIKREGQ